MIKEFILFENLQQAEKFVSNQEDTDIRKLDLIYYKKLKDYLKSIGKLGHLYTFTLLLYSHGKYAPARKKEYKANYDKLIKYLKLMIHHNIKLVNFTENNILNNGVNLLYNYVDKELMNIYINTFIDKWAPGFLKHELKTKYHLSVMWALYITDGYEYVKKDIDTNMLRGKMSMFKDPKEWANYVSSCERETSPQNIKKIKKEKDLKIYYENNDWIIYQPFTYEATNIIKYPYWCTIEKYTYKQSVKNGTYWIIFYNKKIKKDSMIAQIIKRDNFAKDENPTVGAEELILHDYEDHSICNYIFLLDGDNDFELQSYWYNDYGKRGEKLEGPAKEIFTVFLKLLDQDKIKNLNKI